MREFMVLVRKEWLEQWRTHKILILAIVFLFVAVTSPILAKLTPELLKTLSVPGMSLKLPEPTYNDALDQFIKNVSQIALLVIVFVVAGAVSDEKNKKTLEIVLTKPISRKSFILSKFGAYFVSITALFVAAALVFYFYTVSIFASFSLVNFAIMSANVCLYILMIVSITIFASTLVRSSVAAGGIGFVSFIMFGSIFGLFASLSKYSPNMIFSKYKDVVANGWNHELLLPLLIIVGVTIVAIYAATASFSRQEIER